MSEVKFVGGVVKVTRHDNLNGGGQTMGVLKALDATGAYVEYESRGKTLVTFVPMHCIVEITAAV